MVCCNLWLTDNDNYYYDDMIKIMIISIDGMLQSVIHRLWGLDLRKSGLSPIFPLKSAILIICQESEEIRLLSFDDLYHCHSKSGFSPADDLYHYHLGAISLQCGTPNSKNINSPLSLAIVTGRIRKYTRNTNNLSYFREISICTPVQM